MTESPLGLIGDTHDGKFSPRFFVKSCEHFIFILSDYLQLAPTGSHSTNSTVHHWTEDLSYHPLTVRLIEERKEMD